MVSMTRWTRALCGLVAAVVVALPVGGCAAGDGGEPGGTALDLTRYRLAGEPVAVAGVRQNLSGVTYVPETKSLWGVINYPTGLVEMTPDGRVKRRLPLLGGGDTEGITALGGGKLAITEEGAQMVLIFDIPAADAEAVDLSAAEAIAVTDSPGGNKGMEGVAYDPKGRRLFVVKEKPPALYGVTLPAEGQDLDKATSRKRWDFNEDTVNISDAAGVCWHADSGHLLVVSDESACVVECTLSGREISRLDVEAPQPEGVAIGPDGTLYVVSEPNVLLVFTPKEEAGD
ncbi:MAG: SdiA-regulated domain-containing protein [Phycisphaerae bacterium]|nr:SdiA-regulated domain-containing protein [Phycisphaerae bacterium]